MRKIATVFILILALTALSTQAQTPSARTSVTGSTAVAPLWEVHLHLQRSFASPLGQHLVARFEKEEPGKFEDFVKFTEAIGLDPRTDIGEVVLFGDGFDEDDVTLIANLGPSTGNLEGWVLAASGYRSEDLDADTLLHSISVEKKNSRAYFAMPKHAVTGNYVLVGSLDEDRTVGLARGVLAGGASPVPNPLEGNSLLKFFVSDLSAVPIKIDENDPGSAIARTIQQIGLNVASDEATLNVAMELTASSAGKARQMSQLLVGLKALVQLAPEEEPEAQKLAGLLDTMVVQHTEGETQVRASMQAPNGVLEELLDAME